MDRTAAIAAIKAAMPNIDQAVLDGMTDDQLIALASNLPAGATAANPDATGDQTAMMADMPQNHDDLVAALVALGQDPATLAGMDDAALQAKWLELTGGQTSMSDAPTGRVAPTGRPAGSGGSAPTGRQPSKVTLQFAEQQTQLAIRRVQGLNTKLAAEEQKLVDRLTELKRKEVAKFCEQLVGEGRIRPVDVPVYSAALMALDDEKATHKFSEGGKTEQLTPFVAKQRELAKLPVIINFGEKIGGKGNTDPKTAAEEEVNKVKKFSDSYGSQFKKDLVAEFVEIQKKNPKITAKQYIGPDLVD